MMDIELKKCIICGNNFTKPSSQSFKWWSTAKYCCRKCWAKSRIGSTNNGRKGQKKSEEEKLKISKSHFNIKPNENSRKKMSNTRKEKIAKGEIVIWHKGTKGILKSCFKDKKRPNISGENHWNYKKDRNIVSDKIKLRKSLEMKIWRRKVFERDNYTCLECGCNGYLEAHYIISMRKTLDPVIVFDINNGITLCRTCHKKTIRREEKYEDKYKQLIKNKNGTSI